MPVKINVNERLISVLFWCQPPLTGGERLAGVEYFLLSRWSV